MRKIIALISIIFIGGVSNLIAQDIETIKAKLGSSSENNTTLKEFVFEIAPNKDTRYSVVLTKSTKYQFVYYQNEPNQIDFNFYKSHKDSKVTFSKAKNTSSIEESAEVINPSIIEEPLKAEAPSKVETGKNIIKAEYIIQETGLYHIVIKNNSNKRIKSALLLNFVEKTDEPEIEEDVVIITKSDKESPRSSDVSDETFFVVEDMPRFNGGKATNFEPFVRKELKYPQEAIDKKIEGRVFVQFTIDKEGYVKDAKVVRNIHPALDQEALRIVYSSPRWKPGKQKGHAVDVIFTFPIIFKLK